MESKAKINNSAIHIPNSELPEGWRWVKLGEVIQEALPGFACGKRAGSGGFIQLRMNNISSRGQIDLSSILRIPATQEQVKKYRLVPGDVIFNNTNSVELVGKTALFNESEGIFLYSNHLTRLRSVQKILDANYLASWLQLQWYQRVFEITCNRWIGQAAVQREKLLDFKIPLPPLLEQKRIGVKIQELMQEVDRARTACEKQLKAANTLSAAYLREIFESEEANKWDRRKLGEVCEIVSKGTTPTTYGYSFVSTGIPFLRAEDINGGAVNFSSVAFHITKETHDFLNRSKLQPGDLLITIAGTLGRVGYVPDAAPEANCNQAVAFARIDSTKAYVKFLCYVLQVQEILVPFTELKAGGTIQNLNLEQVRRIEIPIPDLATQYHIADDLKEKMAQVENIQSAIRNQQSALNSLPQAILRQALNGEL